MLGASVWARVRESSWDLGELYCVPKASPELSTGQPGWLDHRNMVCFKPANYRIHGSAGSISFVELPCGSAKLEPESQPGYRLPRIYERLRFRVEGLFLVGLKLRLHSAILNIMSPKRYYNR